MREIPNVNEEMKPVWVCDECLTPTNHKFNGLCQECNHGSLVYQGMFWHETTITIPSLWSRLLGYFVR